ncbi:uncharacterized protein DNG_04212 [Cephalotrichum gorgonifer]|uniref:Myb/SANT-like domain-containing protein n=1 Tax=Cephalotrichum gorgonifer TaxID=2041049 RepID=A0AAE8MYD0_9PEZI|nr:uncharacterized protein DNG_04212 [Cephalotrichum gorgonifer]
MSDDEFGHHEGRANPSDKRAPRFSWTPAYEATFFRSLCESVQLGLRENHSFKAEAWDRAAAALREQHGAYPTKSHLVNKSDNARKKFRLWRGLREHPGFSYNPANRTVVGSDEAWKGHIEKEPLSRALRGRPFDHEEFMEILYPDVVGSGGAPKRIMKPKRKGPDALPGSEDSDMPGTAILNLQVDQSAYQHPLPQPQAQAQTHNRPAQQQQRHTMPPGSVARTGPRPTSTTMPPRTSMTNTSALTPPDETTTTTRKRFMPTGQNNPGAAQPTTGTPQQAPQQNKRRRISSQPNNVGTPATNGVAVMAPSAPAATSLEDGLLDLLRLRAPAAPRWPEQALEIFFRDFSDEDMDLQLKIAEKALADENKAMVFCKMPAAVRRHWVKRLREAHNRSL